MALTHTITALYNNAAGQVVNTIDSISGDIEKTYGAAVPAGTTNLEIDDFNFTLTQLQSVCLKSDVAVTIKTNSTGSPQDTIVLAPATGGVGCVIWNKHLASSIAGVIPNPFAGNVTKIFVTNATASTANVVLTALVQQ